MRAIIVLGMHRSGTSAVTRAIGLLGAEMGDAERMQRLWENIPLRNLNEKLFGLGNGTWDAPPEPGWLDSKRARALLDRARRTVADQFGSAQVAVWKDPRTCVTLPFWLDVFEAEPVFLLIHRHPTEVADSLGSRNKLGRGHGYAMWERYNADALRSSQGHPTVVLEYGALVTDPVGSLASVSRSFADFGVTLPNDPATTDHGLVLEQRHHTASAVDEIDGETATASQQDLFALLRDLNGAHAELALPRQVPAAHPLSLELLTLARRYRFAKRAHRKEREHSSASEAAAKRPPPGAAAKTGT